MSSCKEILSFSKARQNTFSKLPQSQHNKKLVRQEIYIVKETKGSTWGHIKSLSLLLKKYVEYIHLVMPSYLPLIFDTGQKKLT